MIGEDPAFRGVGGVLVGLRDRVDGARRAAGSAVEKGAGGLRAAGGGAASLGRATTAKTQNAVTDFDWFTELVTNWPVPEVPPAEPWKLSIGAVLSRHPAVPAKAGRLLSLLDGFGAISIGPESFGFDGDEIEWDKITEVRVRPLGDFVLGAVFDDGIDELSGRLPPIPGRKWAVTKVTRLFLAVASALREQVEEEPGDRPPVMIPCEIVYRGRIRDAKESQAGLFAGFALAEAPDLSAALLENVALHKIPVVEAPPHEFAATAARRGQALRRHAISLRRRVAPCNENPGNESPGGEALTAGTLTAGSKVEKADDPA